MRICRYKHNGLLIEMQSHATAGTLLQNAVNAGIDINMIEELEITESEYASLSQPDMTDSNRSRLWRAADSYQAQYISSVAIGLLTIGVLQNKPKALAIMTWTQALWSEYYTRKPLITHDSPESMFDFSSVGAMPYSIPELQAEVLA